MQAALDGEDAAGIGQQRARAVTLRQPRFSVLVAVLCVILCLGIVPPTLFLVWASLHTTNPDGSFGALTLQYYAGLASDPNFLASLANATIYACGSAFVALLVGTVQALIVERTNTPGRSLVLLGAVISLGIPQVLYVVAWLLLLGRAGPVNDLLAAATGTSVNVYSMWGMILIEGIGFVPLTFLMMSSVLRATDAAFEEASMMSGAGPMRTFRNVTLRMSLPGILALMLLLFVRGFESFEVPALVGLAGNIRVLTTDIYQASRHIGVPNFGQSAAYAMSLLGVVVLLLSWYSRLSRHAHQYQTITGKGYRPRVIAIGRWRFLTAGVLILIFLLVTGLPLGMLVFTSLQPFYEGVTADSLHRFTLENYAEILRSANFSDAVLNTVMLGAATASIVVPLTALCAWLAARRRPGAWLLDQLATSPLVFPAIVMSVAFLFVFVNLPLPLYGTLASVVIASSVRYLPYGMRYAYAGVLQIHVELEDASSAAGARRLRTFVAVIAPLLTAALVSCWLFVFLLAVQAVSLPLLLVGPGTEIVAVTLFDLWQNGQSTELAAMGVIWMGLMTTVSACFYFITRRYQIATR